MVGGASTSTGRPAAVRSAMLGLRFRRGSSTTTQHQNLLVSNSVSKAVRGLYLLLIVLLIAARHGAVEGRPSSSGGSDPHHHTQEEDDDDDSSDPFWTSLGRGRGHSGQQPYGPYFDPVYPMNISVLAGQPVVLACRVKNIADKVVSWVRQSDLAILASAGVSHTSDSRISAASDADQGDWQLRIQEALIKDSGLYECQVNTEPKINWPVHLHVEAVASIGGASELYVRTGSTISLTCSVRGTGAISPRVPFWFHEDKPIALDSPRGGISLETERTTTGMTSKLLLTRAAPQDGGNYTCSPPGAQAAVITVHVLNGEHPAAMQRGNRSPGGINSAINSPFYLHSYLSVCIVQIVAIHQLLGWISTGSSWI